jgi:hypothetical protein
MKCSVNPIPGLGREGEGSTHEKAAAIRQNVIVFVPIGSPPCLTKIKLLSLEKALRTAIEYVWSSLDMSSMYKHMPEARSTETFALC